MSIDADAIKYLIADELKSLHDDRVRIHISQFLIEPQPVYLHWDYGEHDQKHLCWIVFKDEQQGTGIAYSEFGFGPEMPWGLIHLSDEASMGMDCSWMFKFVQAYFDSFTATSLPIWRVFSGGWPGEYQAISAEGSWKETWDRVLELRNANPDIRYHCDTDENARLLFKQENG